MQELTWIGSLSQAPDLVSVWHTAGARTIDEAKRKPIIMGADSGGTMTLYPALLNATLGTRFKIVTGYAGSAAVYHAIEIGEVEGVGSTPWTSSEGDAAELGAKSRDRSRWCRSG